MISLLIVTSWYPDDENIYNGIFVKRQAIALSELCNVTLVSFKNDYSKFKFVGGAKCNIIIEERFTEIIILVPRSIPIFNQINYLTVSFMTVIRKLYNRKFDIIHGHVSYPAGFLAYLLGRYYKVPYVITEHSSPFEQLFRSTLHKFLALFVIKRAAATIAVSQGLMQIIRKYVNANLIVIPNSVSSGYKLDIILPSKGNRIAIGFLGGLDTDQKGLDILLNALEKVETSNIVLYIAGEGRLKESYIILAEELKISQLCHFIGALKPDEVYSFMRNLDFFVLPSRHESFGIVVLEAMIAGKPVVVTKCGGPEYFVTKDMGLLAEVNNVDDLAIKIEEMRTNYIKYDSNLIANYTWNNFNSKNEASTIIQLYNSILFNEK